MYSLAVWKRKTTQALVMGERIPTQGMHIAALWNLTAQSVVTHIQPLQILHILREFPINPIMTHIQKF